ncbi:MAG: DUF4058 family protein [Cyanobacteria bacterium P01_F01_bin.3]
MCANGAELIRARIVADRLQEPVTMPSPFPGMDPYLEHPDVWPEVHIIG